jgi:HK97 gp10 family phage protein
MSISLDELTPRLGQIINDYTEKVKKDIEARLDKTSDEIIQYLKTNAPRGNSKVHLADTFIKSINGDGASKTVTIYSKEKGSLIHLIEFGFTHRSCKYVPARPFMRPAYDKLTPKMMEEIRAIIMKG